MINVRAFAGGDGPDVLRINSASRPAVAALEEQELSRLLALPNHHLVAEHGTGAVVGYALVFGREAAYDGEEFLAFRHAIPVAYLYIDQVAVSAEFGRTGIGSALYGKLESIAGRCGARLLCCEVNTNPPNANSMAFHRKMKFNSIGSLATLDGREVELLTRVTGS